MTQSNKLAKLSGKLAARQFRVSRKKRTVNALYLFGQSSKAVVR